MAELVVQLGRLVEGQFSSIQFVCYEQADPVIVQLFFVIYVFVFYVGLLIVRLSFVSDIVFYWSVDSEIDCIVSAV